MNLLEMPDSKIYELGIRILVAQLGPDGTTRFLGICKPRKDEVKVRTQPLSHAEMKKIREQVYLTYRATAPMGHRDSDQISDMDFYKLGLDAILDQIGPVGMTRFIGICRPGTGDYTAERHQWLDTLDSKTILEGIQQVEREIKAEQTGHLE